MGFPAERCGFRRKGGVSGGKERFPAEMCGFRRKCGVSGGNVDFLRDFRPETPASLFNGRSLSKLENIWVFFSAEILPFPAGNPAGKLQSGRKFSRKQKTTSGRNIFPWGNVFSGLVRTAGIIDFVGLHHVPEVQETGEMSSAPEG